MICKEIESICCPCQHRDGCPVTGNGWYPVFPLHSGLYWQVHPRHFASGDGCDEAEPAGRYLLIRSRAHPLEDTKGKK